MKSIYRWTSSHYELLILAVYLNHHTARSETIMFSYFIVLVIVVMRMMREREVRPSRMWITPALFILLTLQSMVQSPNLTPTSVLLDLLCLVVGLGIGLWRGKLEKVRLHPVSGKVTSQSSVVGIIIFMSVMLLRLLAGYLGEQYSLISFSTALLFIPLGSICMRSYCVYLKFQQLQGQ